MKYLFEVSWEVCNKVGGIHTVISTKAEQAIKTFGEGYITFGPDLGQVAEFEECENEFFAKLKPFLEEVNLPCRFGRWKIPGKPLVILVGGFKERFNVERLLYAFWEEYGVDSHEGSWDYVEPILFSTTCAEVIELITSVLLKSSDNAVAHFHEWMCGAGILYLKRNMPNIGTVLTTHATVLGRSLAHNNPLYYTEVELGHNVADKAYRYGVKSKHSIESISAMQADCFTTVSDFTARESALVLSRRPDVVVYNGLNTKDIHSGKKSDISKNKKKLLSLCSEFLNEKLPEKTKFWVSSGRYEYKNKGYDLVIESMAKLKTMVKDQTPIIMLILVAADQRKVQNYEWPNTNDPEKNPIAITPVYNPDQDVILNACKHFGLDRKDSPIRVILSTLYLDGSDGIFNMNYTDILDCADLTLFPSFYEPWGYTPLESAVQGVPTITSDLSGFGQWMHTLEGDWRSLVRVLPRRNKSHEQDVNSLANLLLDMTAQQAKAKDSKEIKNKANELSKVIDWSVIYSSYIAAYDIALAKAYDREMSSRSHFERNPFKEAECQLNSTAKCQMKCLELDVPLPDSLLELNKLAHNLWWCWDNDAKRFFREINPKLWHYLDHNPVRLLKSIPYSEFERLSKDSAFMSSYKKVCDKYNKYMKDYDELVDTSKPVVAYFSMEYGIHESLPIYSGGLGILSGDHLKTSSDQNLNMVAIGLFYHNGYFIQEINPDGYQMEHYPFYDWKNLSLKILLNQFGEPVKIPVEFPDRTVWTRVLWAQVGRVPLFLFDTNIDENKEQDRSITSRLYVADRKTRIEQEILIGIAGIRLLKDVLNLDPAVYHLNEGHCAFITVELIRRLMQQGFSFEAACKTIKPNIVFTTHTPVPAGNEIFSNDLMKAMFSHTFSMLNVPIEKFLELGKQESDPYNFCMTVIAFKLSAKSNAVSVLHEDVSYEMWRALLKDRREDFMAVTNGVHTESWMSEGIYNLCLDHGLYGKSRKIRNIPNEKIWEKHQESKQALIDYVRQKVIVDYTRNGIEIDVIKNILTGLNKDTLLIGFARRFAEYKRADLLFSDINRLKSIIQNQDRPVTIIFAGKAHPAGTVAKEIIRSIYKYVFEKDFEGRLIVLENYNMSLARMMVRGVDAWLNTPIIRMEACGTSGMKAAMNGALNVSIPDGWWAEGYARELGWSITPSTNPDHQQAMHEETQVLYRLLEEEIVPCFYQRDKDGIPQDWVDMMKASIDQVSLDFGADRMIRDYEAKLYNPIAKKTSQASSLRV